MQFLDQVFPVVLPNLQPFLPEKMASGGDQSVESLNVEDNDQVDKRPQFGNRFLTDPRNVFEHNAWYVIYVRITNQYTVQSMDNVVWDEEQELEARKKVEEQMANPATPEKQEEYEQKASEFWNSFYDQHQDGFFKDRNWLFTEFPELAPEYASQEIQKANQIKELTISLGEHKVTEGNDKGDNSRDLSEKTYPGSSASFRILEVGCGAGNTVFPVLQTNNDPNLMVYCCDFSSTAIDLVKEHPDYNTERCHAFVCDICDESTTMLFPQKSLDVIVMIFVLSAIKPEKMQSVIDRLSKYLKPGGRCISENFYARGDGTMVYFFTQEEMKNMFEKAGLIEKQNLIDRRLQVNRGKQLKMYRVWIQYI
ncbi:hypothetical protein KUTeg_008600 [Tegillarca granosa]|uniref:Methyltransferase type 12 domain-containing protein n=1 Tax=Tegillarca granosa TaxID=220873 RepID=A0ABQ9F9M5_TEGGR|nr:hypothetical protein KUTeg_008600 [Tegillarca granosa]